ncbi:MAG: GyrI-like domain-containing protein [Firmicutes bacterium]|nr:GyrI-like domain-containing protein [Bacillota bacterium]
MDYRFEVVDSPAMNALSMRTVTPAANLPQELGKAYTAIIAYLGEIGEQPCEAAFAAYYNMDMEKLDVEMGFPVPRPLPGRGEIKASQIPAGKAATYLYQGPYQEMAPVYEAMSGWMSDSGLQPIGVVYEFYYNSPMEVPASELLTKIVFPLK